MGLLSYPPSDGITGLLGGQLLPDYAGAARQAVNGMDAQPASQPHHGFNWGDAALGFLLGPQGAQAIEMHRMRKLEQQKVNAALQIQAQQQARLQAAFDSIDADPNMSPQEKAIAKASFEDYAKKYDERFGSTTLSPDQQMRVYRGGGQYDTVEGPKATREVDGILVQGDKPIWETPYPKIVQGPQGGFYQQPRLGIDAMRGGAQPQPAGLAPGQQAAPAGLPRPSTQQERDALPPGTPYIAPDGSLKRTPGGAGPSGPQPFPFGQ